MNGDQPARFSSRSVGAMIAMISACLSRINFKPSSKRPDEYISAARTSSNSTSTGARNPPSCPIMWSAKLAQHPNGSGIFETGMPRYCSTSSRLGTFSGTLRSPSRSSMKTISRDVRDGSIRWNALRTNDGRRISAIVPRCGKPDGPKPLWKITGRAGSYAATRSASRRASSRGHNSATTVLPGCDASAIG